MGIFIGTAHGVRALEGTGPAPARGRIGALAHDGAALWSVVDDREVWRGAERVATAPLDVTSLAVRGGVALVGTATARLFRLDPANARLEACAGFDALDRRAWGTPWGGPPDVMTLAILDDGAQGDAAQEGAWLAGVHVGGVWRSDDSGRTWREVVATERDDHHISARGDVIAVACGGGPLALSTDGGRTFAFPAGAPHGYGTAVALAGDSVVLACSRGPFAKASAIVRVALTGAPRFAPVHEARANVHALAAHGDLVALADDDGRVALSRDAGQTWQDAGALGAQTVLVTP